MIIGMGTHKKVAQANQSSSSTVTSSSVPSRIKSEDITNVKLLDKDSKNLDIPGVHRTAHALIRKELGLKTKKKRCWYPPVDSDSSVKDEETQQKRKKVDNKKDSKFAFVDSPFLV